MGKNAEQRLISEAHTTMKSDLIWTQTHSHIFIQAFKDSPFYSGFSATMLYWGFFKNLGLALRTSAI